MLAVFLFFVFSAACNPNLESCIAQNPGFPPYHFEHFQSPSPHFKASRQAPQVAYTPQGLELSIHKRFDNPQVVSDGYILYGKAEAVMKALNAPGIITLFYLQSDDLDEIDIAEVTGSFGDVYMSNFFVKGNTLNYDRGGYHTILDPRENYHKYGVEWSPHEITWLVDDQVVRRLGRDNVHGYPLSPMRVFVSVWAGGDPDNHPGTIWWAGGETKYDTLPFTMFVESVMVVNYSPWSMYVYGKGVELHALAPGEIIARDQVPGSGSTSSEHVKRSVGSNVRLVLAIAAFLWCLAAFIVSTT